MLGAMLCMGLAVPAAASDEAEILVQNDVQLVAEGSVSDNDPSEPEEPEEPKALLSDVHAGFGSWSYPYDHTEAKSLYVITLSKPSHVTWTISRTDSGELFNTYEGDFPAGENNLTWHGVDQNGEHPAGTVESPTWVHFRVLIRAEAEDGETAEQTVSFSFRYTHDFTSHKDYIEEHEDPAETPAPTETPVPTEMPAEEVTETPAPTEIPAEEVMETPVVTPAVSTAPPTTAAAASPPAPAAAAAAEPDVPKTADPGSGNTIYILIMAAAAAGCAFSFRLRKQL